MIRAEMADGTGNSALAEQIQEAVRSICRVRVDEVVFLDAGTIKEDEPGMVDARNWG